MKAQSHNTQQSRERELRELIAELLAGRLDEQQGARLSRILEQDPSARQQYREHCQMQALLESEHGVLTAVTDRPQQSEYDNRHKRFLLRRPKDFSSRQWRLWAVGLAAALLLALALPFVRIDSSHPEAGPANALAVPVEIGPPVATLARAVGAKLEFRGRSLETLSAGDGISAGEYALRSGLLELTFDCGASIVVECPAAFEIIDADKVLFTQGRLSAYVPDEARGFTVETPTATAVDLGTAFAVEVRANEDDEFHVFDGKVQVWPRGALQQEPFELTGGLATRVERGSGVPAGIGLDLWRFVRELNEPESRYSDLVQQLDPVVYYRMRPDGDGYTLRDESGNHHHGTIITDEPQKAIWAASPIGAALRLRGESVPTFAVVPDYPKAADNQLSVVALVYANSRPRWASIAKNWSSRFGQFHFGLYDFQGGLEAHVNNGRQQEITVRDPEPFPLETWCHVAFVADGKNLNLYRDGRLVDQAPCPVIAADPDIPQLAIGTKLNTEGQDPENPDCSFWDGRLDEVAVFNHALSPAEVRQLYDLSREGASL